MLRDVLKVTRRMGKRLKALRHATLQVLNSLSHARRGLLKNIIFIVDMHVCLMLYTAAGE